MIIRQNSCDFPSNMLSQLNAINIFMKYLMLRLITYYQNGTVRFKNCKQLLNTNIYSYLEASSGQSSNLYYNIVQFFNTGVN